MVVVFALQAGGRSVQFHNFLADAVKFVWLVSTILLYQLMVQDMFAKGVHRRRLHSLAVLCFLFFDGSHSIMQKALSWALCVGLSIVITVFVPLLVVQWSIVGLLLLLSCIQLLSLLSGSKIGLKVHFTPACVLLPLFLAALLLVDLLARGLHSIEVWQVIRILAFAMKGIFESPFMEYAKKRYVSELVLLHRKLCEYNSMVRGMTDLVGIAASRTLRIYLNGSRND
eukprot:g9915.t1